MDCRFLLALFAANAALPAVAAETEFLRQMTGCFDVSYRYLEDGDHAATVLAQRERIVLVSEGEIGVKLQHYFLQNGEFVKHWREEWMPLGGGAYRQSIFGPDGSLRYACEARFSHSQWRCVTPSAPKPRRDEARGDYQWLDRDATLQITPEGFAVSERNEKRDNAGNLVSNETGWNEYTKLSEDLCPDANFGGASHF